MDKIAQVDMFGPSVEEEKARLMIDGVIGTHCRCCTKSVNVYHRKFNSGMALTMIYTYPWFRSHPQEWLGVLKFCATRHNYVAGEIGKLLWWGLMEKNKCAKPQQGARVAGLYRMTEKGFAFVQGRKRIQSHVWEYLSEVQSFDGDTICIRDALNRKFDYRELMRAAGVMA